MRDNLANFNSTYLTKNTQYKDVCGVMNFSKGSNGTSFAASWRCKRYTFFRED